LDGPVIHVWTIGENNDSGFAAWDKQREGLYIGIRAAVMQNDFVVYFDNLPT
jgi:hypothetical protein